MDNIYSPAWGGMLEIGVFNLTLITLPYSLA